MSLAELRIENLRCLQEARLELSAELNLVYGENGAGKSSILEAIFLLGRGRSFRTRSTEKLIRHGTHALTVYGRTDGLSGATAGVEVTREGTRARINGSNAQSLLELSGALPVQAIEPDIHKLVEQGPERRRRWLDWLVFHVEPTFASHWTRYQRALKQRNAALKFGVDASAWDSALTEHGNEITRARQTTLHAFEPYFNIAAAGFVGLCLTLGFFPGWSHEQTFAEALASAATRDRERGSTTVGPHRADVILRASGKSARETLSRGQQKLAGISLIIAQLRMLKAERAMRSVLLLDDPAAELDPRNLQQLFRELLTLDCQMIATSLRRDTELFQPPKATFHVEHGHVIQL